MGTILGADPSVRKLNPDKRKLKIGHVIKSNVLVGKNLFGVGAVGLGVHLRVLVDGDAITRMHGLWHKSFLAVGSM